MKFFKSKFFLIAVIFALVLSLVPALLAAFGQTDIIRSALATAAKPFAWCASRAADGIGGFVSVFTDYDRLQKENESLLDSLESIEAQSAENEALRAENEWLKKFLATKTAHPELKMTDAVIVSHESGNFSTVLTLNRGSAHGIKKNMPVITPDGVLGYVGEVGLDWCKVVSIIESDSHAGTYDERSLAMGTLEGDPALRADGKCMITYEATADIKVGDRVYTSGTGNIYPYGLLLGTIESISADEGTRTLVATVSPAVDFSSLDSLSRVMIVYGYTESGGGKK